MDVREEFPGHSSPSKWWSKSPEWERRAGEGCSWPFFRRTLSQTQQILCKAEKLEHFISFYSHVTSSLWPFLIKLRIQNLHKLPPHFLFLHCFPTDIMHQDVSYECHSNSRDVLKNWSKDMTSNRDGRQISILAVNVEPLRDQSRPASIMSPLQSGF